MLLTSCCTYDSSCIVVKLWDGYYSRHKIHEEMEKKRKEDYENKTLEEKQLILNNQKFCDYWSEQIYNENKKRNPIKIMNMSRLYTDCMKDKGTPEF